MTVNFLIIASTLVIGIGDPFWPSLPILDTPLNSNLPVPSAAPTAASTTLPLIPFNLRLSRTSAAFSWIGLHGDDFCTRASFGQP